MSACYAGNAPYSHRLHRYDDITLELIELEFPKIHCTDVAYRSGFVEVRPNIHPGHVNLEVWHLHPDADRCSTDIAVDRMSDTDVIGNTEIELNVPQARDLMRLLGLALEAVEEHGRTGGPR